MQQILEQIAITAELMGNEISPTAAAVMASDLSIYSKATIIEALSHVRKEAKGRLSLALIIEKIEELTPNGRPSPEEAWALVPKNEDESAVITDEIARALGVAQSLIDDCDMVAARMAFKESYSNIVKFNKLHGIQATWFPSLGHDKNGREPALAEAVRNNRIELNHALSFCAPEKQDELLQMVGKKQLALENSSNKENLKRIKELSLMIGNKNAR